MRSTARCLGLLAAILAFIAPTLLAQTEKPKAPAGEAPADKVSAAAPAKPKFIRFRETGDKEGALEVRIARLRNEAGVTVDLVSAVHIGDKAYYRDLDRRFAGYDAVLFEMIMPKGADPSKRAGGTVSKLQRMMKDALALEFQLDAVDYGRANFVHADMDPAMFRREQKANRESIMKLLIKSAFKQWGAQMSGSKKGMGYLELFAALMNKDSSRALKLVFARQMAEADEMLSGLGGEGGTVIIEGRNKVAIKVLKEQIAADKKKLAVFYGAGHMPDLERRLMANLGMKPVSDEWLIGWDVRSVETQQREAAAAKERTESDEDRKPAADGKSGGGDV